MLKYNLSLRDVVDTHMASCYQTAFKHWRESFFFPQEVKNETTNDGEINGKHFQYCEKTIRYIVIEPKDTSEGMKISMKRVIISDVPSQVQSIEIGNEFENQSNLNFNLNNNNNNNNELFEAIENTGIWAGVPEEVMNNVMDFFDAEALSKWISTCRYFHWRGTINSRWQRIVEEHCGQDMDQIANDYHWRVPRRQFFRDCFILSCIYPIQIQPIAHLRPEEEDEEFYCSYDALENPDQDFLYRMKNDAMLQLFDQDFRKITQEYFEHGKAYYLLGWLRHPKFIPLPMLHLWIGDELSVRTRLIVASLSSSMKRDISEEVNCGFFRTEGDVLSLYPSYNSLFKRASYMGFSHYKRKIIDKFND